jgi:hypothetical protein
MNTVLTLDHHEQFVQVPGVAQASLPSPERPGVFDTKLPTPLSDGCVADCDAPLRREDLPHLGNSGRICGEAKQHG